MKQLARSSNPLEKSKPTQSLRQVRQMAYQVVVESSTWWLLDDLDELPHDHGRFTCPVQNNGVNLVASQNAAISVDGFHSHEHCKHISRGKKFVTISITSIDWEKANKSQLWEVTHWPPVIPSNLYGRNRKIEEIEESNSIKDFQVLSDSAKPM